MHLFSKSKSLLWSVAFAIGLAASFTQCHKDNDPAPIKGPVKSCSSCTFVILGDEHTITVDGIKLGVEPGDTICLDAAAKYGSAFIFDNIIGTEAKPVIITNCGGTVNLKVTNKGWNFKTSHSKYFRLTGGDTDGYYGISMTGSTGSGLALTDLSTNFEVDHIEIFKVGFAGIIAKTDPKCDDATVRPNFVMKNVSLHHNYMHDTEGEGFYIGHSSYGGTEVEGCGTRYPHTIEGINVYSNHVVRSGWDGIQLSCATKNAAIFDNVIENYATANEPAQQNGIIIGGGSAADCYRNFINKGTGNGIVCFGLGSNVIHDNVVLYSGEKGIFCDERSSDGDGVKILNNTIINPAEVGIAIYTETLPNNVCVNNIIVNPGFYNQWHDGAFINHGKDLVFTKSNNITTLNINDVKFVNTKNNFRLQSTSPAIDQGFNISTYGIDVDFYKVNRKNGTAYDIGASEF